MYKFRMYFDGDYVPIEKTEHCMLPLIRNMRDSERAKSYDAEDSVFDMFDSTISQKDAIEFIRYIESSIIFKTRQHKPLKIIFRRKHGSWASFARSEVSLSTRSLNPLLICHELAHVITPKSHDGGGHGKLWRTHYLKLLFVFVSPRCARKLARAFDNANLAYEGNY